MQTPRSVASRDLAPSKYSSKWRRSARNIIGELKWLVPFLCLGVIALVEIRPEPQAPAPEGERTIVDARGKPVHIALPFRGSVLTRGTEIPDYLEATRAPDTLLAVTANRMGERVRNHIIGKIYPQVVSSARIWASAGVSDTQGPKVDTERLLLFDPGVFMGWYTLAEPIERVGLPFIGFKTFPATFEDLGYSVRTYSAVVGNPERGEAILGRDQQLNQDLDREITAKKYIMRPR